MNNYFFCCCIHCTQVDIVIPLTPLDFEYTSSECICTEAEGCWYCPTGESECCECEPCDEEGGFQCTYSCHEPLAMCTCDAEDECLYYDQQANETCTCNPHFGNPDRREDWKCYSSTTSNECIDTGEYFEYCW